MVITLINALITCIRPIIGPPGACRFELPCSDFARMELHDKKFFCALLSISKRVLLCNPLTHLFHRQR